jgi:hypothetical protein
MAACLANVSKIAMPFAYGLVVSPEEPIPEGPKILEFVREDGTKFKVQSFKICWTLG